MSSAFTVLFFSVGLSLFLWVCDGCKAFWRKDSDKKDGGGP